MKRSLGKVTKIIISTNEWFTNEKYQRNQIDIIREYGFDVEIWNMNKLVFEDESIPPKPLDLYQGDIKVINFETREELRNQIRENRAYAIIFNWYPENSEMRTFCEEKIRYCNIMGAPMLASIYLKNIEMYDKKRGLLDLLRIIREFIMVEEIRTYLMWPPICNYAATRAEYLPIYRFFSKKRLKFVHALDYDKILSSQEEKEQKYIVFLDIAWGIHPEYAAVGLEVSSEELAYYYDLMNQLFDYLENRYDMEVIIAAHPKAEYKGNEYKHRKIVIFNTQELIRKSSFVVAHISTAMNIVVAYDKPFLPVIYKGIREFYGNTIKMTEDYFGCQFYELESGKDVEKYLFYNKDIYEKFFDDFVAGDKDQRLYMRILLDDLKKRGAI